MDQTLCEHPFDLVGGNQRPRSVVHGDVSRRGLQLVEPSAHGILPAFSTPSDRSNLFEVFIAHDGFDFVMSIFARDNNNSIDRVGVLECGYGVREDWFAGNRRKQFIETHAAAVPSRDNDCA
jgi:hypothetical protein